MSDSFREKGGMHPRLTFAQISDSHLLVDRDGSIHGQNVYRGFARAVDFLRSIESELAFVLHSGDIVHKDALDAYPRVQELISGMKAPWYFVRGNYDDTLLMDRQLPFGPRERRLGSGRQTYAFSVEDESFVVLDSEKDSPDWCGRVEEGELEFLRSEIERRPKALTVFIHYPPFSAVSPWADRQMVLKNGEALHRTLKEAHGTHVRGVFFGHIHRFFAANYDGILYASAPSTGYRFATLPLQAEIQIDRYHGPAVSLVTLEGLRTTAREFILTA